MGKALALVALAAAVGAAAYLPAAANVAAYLARLP